MALNDKSIKNRDYKIDVNSCSDEDWEKAAKVRKEKKRKQKAKSATARTEYKGLLEKYCLGKISRDELPENGFGFSLSDIFTAFDYEMPRFKNPNNENEVYSGVGKKPEWLRTNKELTKQWNKCKADSKARAEAARVKAAAAAEDDDEDDTSEDDT